MLFLKKKKEERNLVHNYLKSRTNLIFEDCTIFVVQLTLTQPLLLIFHYSHT